MVVGIQRRVTGARPGYASGMGIDKDSAKEALKNDWEQTKHDVGVDDATDLDQDVDDTVRQMAGKEDPKMAERTNTSRSDS